MFVPAVRDDVLRAGVGVETSRLGVGPRHDGEGFAADVQPLEVLAAGLEINGTALPTDAVEVHYLDTAVVIEEDIARGEVAVQHAGVVELRDELRDRGETGAHGTHGTHGANEVPEGVGAEGFAGDVVRLAQKAQNAHFLIGDGFGRGDAESEQPLGVLVTAARFALAEEAVPQRLEEAGFGEGLDDEAVVLEEGVSSLVNNGTHGTHETHGTNSLFRAEEIQKS